MGKYLKRIGTFFTMLLMLTALWSMTAMAATDTDRNAFYVQVPADWESPCVWAWDSDGNNAFEAWPGEEMEADPENEGWYYIWLPSFANHVIVNANDGSVQTEEQILDSNAAWMTVKAADTVEVTYEKQTSGEAPAYTEKFTVHAKVDESWENPCLWAWSAPDGTNAFASWPGEVLEEGENGWLQKTVPGWINSVIVNGNDGSVQTTDISVESGKDIWLVVNGPEDYTVSYEEPELAAETEADTATEEVTEAETAEEAEAVEETKEKSSPAGPIVAAVVVVAAGAGIGIAAKKKKAGK